MLQLRQYQQESVDAVFTYYANGGTGNALIAQPTGTGKSVVIAAILKRMFEESAKVGYNPRALMLTHVKELIGQNFRELVEYWPSAPAGVYSAGLKRRDIGYPITFAGIQTVKDMAGDFQPIDMIIIDEAHLVSHNAETMYRSFIRQSLAFNPNLKVIGLTATPFRSGQGYLTDEGGIFDEIVHNDCTLERFNMFIEEGFLCNLVAPKMVTDLDIEGVKTTAGDFNLQDLQSAVNQDSITRAAIGEAVKIAEARKHWLVFASGIEHTIRVCELFEEVGVRATYVHSKMAEMDRDKNIADYMAGKYRVMVNNGILTTGFNFKPLDCIMFLRPTRSPNLHVQMLGRGTRPFYSEGYDLETTNGRLWSIYKSQKPNCLVLDFAGNLKRLGPINDPRIPRKKGERGGEAPIKVCGGCGLYTHSSVRICKICGYEFPVNVTIEAEASTEDVVRLVDKPIVEYAAVTHIVYQRKETFGKPDTMLVTYTCGYNHFKEVIAFEHGGNATRYAMNWWRRRSFKPIPVTTNDALARANDGELLPPSGLMIWSNRKPYPLIRDFIFDGTIPTENKPAESRAFN